MKPAVAAPDFKLSAERAALLDILLPDSTAQVAKSLLGTAPARSGSFSATTAPLRLCVCVGGGTAAVVTWYGHRASMLDSVQYGSTAAADSAAAPPLPSIAGRGLAMAASAMASLVSCPSLRHPQRRTPQPCDRDRSRARLLQRSPTNNLSPSLSSGRRPALGHRQHPVTDHCRSLRSLPPLATTPAPAP